MGDHPTQLQSWGPRTVAFKHVYVNFIRDILPCCNWGEWQVKNHIYNGDPLLKSTEIMANQPTPPNVPPPRNEAVLRAY